MISPVFNGAGRWDEVERAFHRKTEMKKKMEIKNEIIYPPHLGASGESNVLTYEPVAGSERVNVLPTRTRVPPQQT